MCTRFFLVQEHLRNTLKRLGVPAPGTRPATRYNIPPTSVIPAVRHAPSSPAAREYATLHWGLVPAWARERGKPLVNARAETVADKPTFRDAFAKRRCLILASGFYEWKAIGRSRQPWLFRRSDESPFCFAGIWDRWSTPEGAVLESTAFITTAANALMAPIHPRMPVVLAENHWEAWLDPSLTEPTQIVPLLQPWPADLMQAMAVSSRVNNVRNDDDACLEPAGDEPANDDQLPLL